jgi:serine/threonine protein kinase
VKGSGLLPGFTFDEYEIVREVGRGGMGVVYQALDSHERRVAIKTLRFARTVDEKEELRFKNEIRILHSIDHVNVVRFFKAGRLEVDTGSVLWVALEFLDGPSLCDVISERPGRLDHEDVIRWAKQIADGLTVAHSLGVTHRDLKPANVKFDGKTIKVIDFGIASARDIGGLTAANATVGTLGYMAPEQLESSQRADARADVFALGIIIYEMATGRHPMARDGEPPTTAELIARLLTSDAPPLKDIIAGFPPYLSDVAQRAMVRDREGRYATMMEMRKALESAMRTHRSAHRPLMLGALSGNFEPLSPLSQEKDPPTDPIAPAPTDEAGRGGWTPQQLATVRVDTPLEALNHPRAQSFKTKVSGAESAIEPTVRAPRQPAMTVASSIDATQAMDGPPSFDSSPLHASTARTTAEAPVLAPASGAGYARSASPKSRAPLAAVIGSLMGIILGLGVTTSLRAIAGGGEESAPDLAAAAPAESATAAVPVEQPVTTDSEAEETEALPSAAASASVSASPAPPPANTVQAKPAAPRSLPANPKPFSPPKETKVPFGSKPEF